MREVFNHPTYGEIVYDENIWTGAKTLTIGGAPAFKTSKKSFVFNGEQILLTGNILTGVKLKIGDETIKIVKAPSWYETVLIILPFVFIMVWGSSPALCSIFPIIGGAIGGLIGAVAAVVSLVLMKKAQSPVKKILIGLGVLAGAIFAAFIVAYILLSLLVSAV